MFALTRLIHFPLILGQVGLNLGKPTLSHLKTANKSYWDKVCTAHYHKLKRDYSSVVTIVNNTDVEETKVQEKECVYKGAIGKIEVKMRMTYTCMKCNTQNTKCFSRQAYERGTVIVICDCCDSIHLVADNLEWFNKKGTNVETMLAERGEQVKRRNVIVSEDGTEIDVQNSTRTC